MNPAWKARLLGGILALGAIPSLVLVADPLGGMLAFALAVTGLFILVVVAEDATPTSATNAILTGDADALTTLQNGLDLDGNPLYVHDQGNVHEERLFLPASRNERPVPILDPDTTVYPGTGDTKVGLALPPPGLKLVHQHEDDAAPLPPKAPLQEAQAFLTGLFTTNDLARGLDATQKQDDLHVRFRPRLETPCQDDPVDPACQRTGCTLCQAAGCALARSLEQPLEVTNARIEDGWVTLTLTPEAPPTDEETPPSSQEAPRQDPQQEARQEDPA